MGPAPPFAPIPGGKSHLSFSRTFRATGAPPPHLVRKSGRRCGAPSSLSLAAYLGPQQSDAFTPTFPSFRALPTLSCSTERRPALLSASTRMLKEGGAGAGPSFAPVRVRHASIHSCASVTLASGVWKMGRDRGKETGKRAYEPVEVEMCE